MDSPVGWSIPLSGIGHPASLCTTSIYNHAHSRNHTSLASHQKSVISVVLSNKVLSNEFCLSVTHYYIHYDLHYIVIVTIHHDDTMLQLTIKCVICEMSTFYQV